MDVVEIAVVTAHRGLGHGTGETVVAPAAAQLASTATGEVVGTQDRQVLGAADRPRA